MKFRTEDLGSSGPNDCCSRLRLAGDEIFGRWRRGRQGFGFNRSPQPRRCDGQKRFGKMLEQKTASEFALPKLTLGIGRELVLRPTNSLA